jgi:hypothetical protein
MSMLGASLEDLDQLSIQLHTTAASIDTVSIDSNRSAQAAVSQLRETGTSAVMAATDHMGTLRDAVERARSRADGASWVGHNAETFRAGYDDFSGAMARAEEATTGYFTELKNVLERLGADTEHYLGDLTAALREAQASTESMSRAVDAQRDNLDQVMNTGMRAG